MTEETHDNTEAPKQTGETPFEKELAQDKLMREITEGSAVTETPKTTSEDAFIDFVEKKSQELPSDPLQKTHEEKTKPEREKKKRESKRGVIRTYHTDVAETVRDQKLSLARIAVAEQQKRGTGTIPEFNSGEKSSAWRRIIFIAASAVLVLGGIALVVFFYLGYRSRTIPAALPFEGIVAANEEATLVVTDLSHTETLDAISAIAENSSAPVDTVINIELITTTGDTAIGAPEFLGLLNTSIDAALLRSIEDPFMLGVHILNDGPQTFLILKTTFFENAFAGMLRWENQIAEELPFLVRSILIPEFEPTATTTATTTLPHAASVSETFDDVVIDNRDARARTGPDGNYDLIYSFANPETLIITSDATTLRTLLERLVVSRFR